MHTISIKHAADIDQNELWHAFYGLLGFMRHSGQLIGRYMEPYAKDGLISATFPTATEDALDAKYHNKYVIDGIEKLEELCGEKLEIKWVGYGEDQEKSICDCTKHKYFLLYYYGEYSPVVCGSCEKQVPLFKMPKLHDFGYWNVTCWQSAYCGCVLIDLNCGTGER
jgi:predicted  nucleic acid-binding Zn ribbon protein